MEQLTPAEILAEQLRLIEKHEAARKAWRGSLMTVNTEVSQEAHPAGQS